jgi:hypothetical protein
MTILEKKQLKKITSVHPQTASFGPERRFRSFEILDPAMPAVSKLLKPCSEPISTIVWTVTN